MKRTNALLGLLILGAVGSATPALAQPTAFDPTLAQIVTGGGHSCAVTTTGGVKCWGSNFGGALGDGTTTQRNVPVTVSGLSGVASLALGNAHSCALNTSGGVKCWGWNVDGQLGDGSNTNRLTPVSVPGLTYGVASLVARGNHTCALTTLGAVKCWGANGSGQLGDGSTVARSTPTGVPDLTTDVVGISAGQEHTCALTRAYGVKCWGNNVYGQLGDGTTANRLAPVNVAGMTAGVASLAAGGYHTCALTAEGGAKCWGYNGYGQVGDGNTAAAQPNAVTVAGLGSGVVALSAASTSTCAVTDAGPAKCWGGNDFGQLGDGTTTNRAAPTDVIGLTSGVADLSANDSHVCARTPNEGAKCWGYNGYGQIGNGTTAAAQTTPALVAGLAVGVAQASAGDGSTCALTPTGGVKCWGDNSNAQLGDLSFTSRSDARDVTGLTSGVRSVSAGASHACVLTAAGGVKCWGLNLYGQLGDGTTTTYRTSPVDVVGLTSGVVSVSAGWFQTCALTTAGGMKCWGRNASGSLGDGTFINRSTPVDVVGLTSGVASAYSSGLTSCAITTSGAAKCWGYNAMGGLGDGTTTNRSTPTNVSGLSSDVASMAMGQYHSCALMSSGGLKCWGRNSEGQVGDGTTVVQRLTPVNVVGMGSDVAAVTVGGLSTCAVTTAGAAKCWGGGGRLGDGVTDQSSTPIDVLGLSSGVSSVSAGGGHRCALSTDGGLRCWGYNGSGQVGDGTTTSRPSPVKLRAVQTISFETPPYFALDSTYPLSATSTSGLSVSFETLTLDTCPVLGTNVTASFLALCGLRANQGGDGNNAPASQVSRLVLEAYGFVPDPPMIGEALPGDGTVTVQFAPPGFDGFNPVTSYTATCGGASEKGYGSPIVVVGLPNGVAVTCTVVATNIIGDSAPSSPSNSVTPSPNANASLTLNLQTVDDGFGFVLAGSNECGNISGGPTTCLFDYAPGTVVHLVAHSSALSVFDGWTGACASQATNPTCDVTMAGGVTVGATFRGPQTLTIQATSFENGLGTIYAQSGSGATPPIQCDAVAGTTTSCSMLLRVGDWALVSALPGPLSVLSSSENCTTGPLDPNGAGCTPFPMSGPASISVTFRGPQTLTVHATSFENGLGTIYAQGGSGATPPIQCDAVAGTTTSCSMLLRVGDWALVSAMPGPLSVLSSSENCTTGPLDPNGAGCTPFPMSGPASISVTFRGPQTLTVHATSFENGLGTIYAQSGSGATPPIQCDAVAGTTTSCSMLLRVGDWAISSAMPGPLSVLSSSENCTTGPLDPNGAGCTPFPMSGPASISVTFRGPQTLTVHATSFENGLGTIYAQSGSGATPPIQCDALAGTTTSCSMLLRVGDWAVSSAMPGALSVLSSSENCTTGPLDPNGAGCTPFAMSGPASISVTFRGPQTLSVGFGGDGSGVVGLGPVGSCASVAGTCTHLIRAGTVQELVADASPDSLFQSWTGACAGQGATCSLTMTAPATAQAVFVLRNHPPTALAGGPYAGVRGQAIALSGAASSDPDSNPLTYSWDFGDGSAPGSGVAPTHAYATTGTFTITLTVNDGTVNSTPATSTVTISNQVPTANAGGPYVGVRNALIAFSGSGSNDPDNDTLTYAWAFGDGGTGTGVAPTHSYATTGTFTVTLTVTDGTASSAPVTTTALISNQAPTANAGGPYPGVRNALITFNGAGSSDPDNDTLAYTWDFGDGSAGSGVAPSHSYSTTGTFTVTLTVNDGTSNSAPATSTVTIANQAPTANAGGPYSGVRNAAVAFSGTGSNDPDNDNLSYAWTFGDGSTGTGASPTHAYATMGTFTVTLVVNDSASNSAPATATVTITNQAPTASAGGPYSGVRNGAITFNGGASTDPDNDGLSYSWDFGDGGTGTGVAPTHAYLATGTFAITLTVNDGTVNSAPATSTVAIANQAPIANAGGPYSGVRNTPITFSGAGSHDSDNDPLTYSWDFGDGSAAGTGVAPTHAYASTGTFTVTLTVNDGTTNSAPATSSVTIANRAPIANPGGPYAGTRLAAISFNGSASSDPDGDALTYSWAFGDGGTGTGATPTHLYTAVGAFTVTLVVNDGTTNSAPVTSTVQITNVTPTVGLTAPSGGAVFNAPANVLVSASAADSDGSVAKVEFFAGAGKIGEALGAPYSITWPATVPGVYTLTAVVTDSSGATAASAPVSVLLNAPPLVSLSAPADGAQFAAPASITLTANASDSDGTIVQVQFFRGTTSLGIDTTSPYSVTWSGAAVGSYTLTAVATDNRGAVVTSTPITVKVTATLTPTADSYVRAQNGNSNFGTDTTVAVQQGTSNGSLKWTYMKFDLSSVPTITSAKVRVFGAVSATTSTVIQTAVYSVSDTTWTETGITWNNKPASGTTALATATIVNNSTTARWYELDVTAYLQSEKAAGRNVVTLAFKNLANSTPFVSFTSKEGTAANRPQVVVVP